MELWGSLLSLAASQHHVMALRQVVTLGIDPQVFRERARREEWTPHGGTIWSPPGIELDPWGRAMAASLRAGSQAAVTGLAALHLHGVERRLPTPIRVVAPMARHAIRTASPDDVRVIASRTLRPGDVTAVRRVPTTRVSRSFLDMMVPPTPSVDVVRDRLITAEQAHEGTIDEVTDHLRRIRRQPGAPVLRQAIAEAVGSGADSPLAHRVVERLHQDGLHPDPRPVPVPTPGRTLHPDITFSAACVCLECDGLLFHRSQRDLAIDGRKNRAYDEVDWLCFRIGWWELRNGWTGFARDLARALARRTR